MKSRKIVFVLPDHRESRLYLQIPDGTGQRVKKAPEMREVPGSRLASST